jgi:hypothetical protein
VVNDGYLRAAGNHSHHLIYILWAKTKIKYIEFNFNALILTHGTMEERRALYCLL